MDDAHHALPLLRDALIFLAAAVFVVLVFARIRISPVLGYLVAGVIIGPSGLALVSEVEEVRTVAELGVVFLLFIIGLELSGERLAALRRWVFVLGPAQVGVTGLVIGGIALAWGNSLEASIVLGACLALSSTAVVVQLLVERGEVASPAGRVGFAVLLFQDLAVVPILVLVTILTLPGDHSIATLLGFSLLKAVAAVAAILVVGRLTLRRLLRGVAATRSTDLFTATALLIVLGTGWITQVSGLSAALGAFLAGLVLAGSEFRHQVETDIQPFKGLLLGLFFLAVGMGIDLRLVLDQALWVVLSVFGLMAVKSLLAAGLALAVGARRDVALRSGLLLGQGGEFAFIVIGVAAAGDLIPGTTAQFMFAVVGLSMLLTPALPVIGDRLAARLSQTDDGEAAAPTAAADGHVVIAGFGRVGQTVARLLSEQQVPFVAVDMDAELVRTKRAEGLPISFGDGSRAETLKQLGVDKARCIVVTMDHPAAAERTVAAVRHGWPHLAVFARSHDRERAAALTALGVTEVVPETFESSIVLARGALQSLGVPTQAVEELVTRYRESDNRGARTDEPSTP